MHAAFGKKSWVVPLATALIFESVLLASRIALANGIPQRGVWVNASMLMTNAYQQAKGLNLLPGVSAGYKVGPLVLAGALDCTYWRMDKDTGEDSNVVRNEVSLGVGPYVEYQFLRFGDLGLYALGSLRFRYYWENREERIATVSSNKPKTKTLGFDLVAGVGGRYYLGRTLGFGLDMGLIFIYAKAKTSEQDRNKHELFDMGPYGRITVAFVW